MGFLKKIGSLFSPSGSDNRSLFLYVRCDKCGEVLKGRVDLYNDLSVQYEDSGKGASYFCRKVFVGSNRCYRPIEVTMTFDKNRQLMNEEINGGDIVGEDEYLASTTKS
jgi:hypothetical protein